MVQRPGQHLLDSFIQVTPERPGIFEAPSPPSPGTRRCSRLVTCSPGAAGGRRVTSSRRRPRGGGGRRARSQSGRRRRRGSGGGGGGGEHRDPRSPGGRVTPRTMCAERLGQFVTLALVLATFDPARGTDATHPPEGPQDRGSQQKGRLSLQNTGECVRPQGGGLPGGPRQAPPQRAHAASPGTGLPPRAVPNSRGGAGRATESVRRGGSAPGSTRPESARAGG